MVISCVTATNLLMMHSRTRGTIKRNRYIFRGDNVVKIILFTAKKRSTLQRTTLLTLGANAFPFRIDLFSDES